MLLGRGSLESPCIFWSTCYCFCRGSWMLFYIIEAAAVYSVLNRYTDEVDAVSFLL